MSVWGDYVAGWEAEAFAAREEAARWCAPPSLSVSLGEDGRLSMSAVDNGRTDDAERRDAAVAAWDAAQARLDGARKFAAAGFPDNCAERGLLESMRELDMAFVGSAREPLTKAWLSRFADDVALGRPRGLLLCGETGTGKTRSAAAVAQAVCGKGFSARYLFAPSALDRIGRTGALGSREGGTEALMDMTDARLVVIDELGRSYGGRDRSQELFALIDMMWTRRRSWMLIANRPLPNVLKSLDGAALDRLGAWGASASFEGASMRRERRPA